MASDGKKKIKEFAKKQKEFAKRKKALTLDEIEDVYQIDIRDANLTIEDIEEDLRNILSDLGIEDTEINEDFMRNIGRIVENKETDTDNLNFFVQNRTERTAEDLDFGLRKEQRRFDLEKERNDFSLTQRNLNLSGVQTKENRQLREGSALNVEDLETTASRSFEDIARFEAEKTLEIERNAERSTEDVTTTKDRRLLDVQQARRQANITGERGVRTQRNVITDAGTF